MLKTILMVFVLLTLASCSSKEIECKDNYIEVPTPIKCKVPDVQCDFNRSTDTEVMASMLECIIDLKRSIEVCK